MASRETRALGFGGPDKIVVRVIRIRGRLAFAVRAGDLPVTRIVVIFHVEGPAVVAAVLDRQNITHVVVGSRRGRGHGRASSFGERGLPIRAVIHVIGAVPLSVDERDLVSDAIIFGGLKNHLCGAVVGCHIEPRASELDPASYSVQLRGRHDSAAIGLSLLVLRIEVLHAQFRLQRAIQLELARLHDSVDCVVVIFSPTAELVGPCPLVHGIVFVDHQAIGERPGAEWIVGGVRIRVVDDVRPMETVAVHDHHIAIRVRFAHARIGIVVGIRRQAQFATTISDCFRDGLCE